VNSKAAHILNLLAPTVQALGFELLGAQYLPAPGRSTLRLYIDLLPGHDLQRAITVDDCEQVSHEVSALLDVEDPISGNYTLEVSSPGVDRPLFTLEQFARHLKQKVKLGLKLPQDNHRRLQGTIVAVDHAQNTVTLALDSTENSPISVHFDNIDRARIVPDWAALGLGAAPSTHGNSRRKNRKKPARPSNYGTPAGSGAP